MHDENEGGGLSRRRFLTHAAAGGVLVTALPLVTARDAQAKKAKGKRRRDWDRSKEAFGKRYDAAANYLRERPRGDQPNNGDEDLYADRRACFHKTLPQNDLGEVDLDAFDALRKALAEGTVEALEAISLSPQAERGLANPLACHAYEMLGPDSWSLRMPPAPAFASAEMAAEMGEVYWQAITRDVPFRNYGSDADIAAAAADLEAFSHRVGSGAPITPATLFRGEAPGEDVGPYLSQLLWLPAQWGLVDLDQKFRLPEVGQDFGLSQADWLAMQRGAEPAQETVFGTTARYLATNRDLAEFVHNDISYQAYLTAALVMLGMGDDTLDPANPYLGTANQESFVTFGVAGIADLVAKAANAALKAAWFQKWLAHRRLRPEAFAGRAEFQQSGARDYGIHADLFDSEAVARRLSDDGNLFLPLAFPEGSPTHPSYPAGHAAVAGACATVLKALFDESYEIADPVEASADGTSLDPFTGAPLTLGGEINKLASNIAIGRDAAGVHYRSDGIDGMNLGEQVGLGVLADYAHTRAELFGGFALTLFDGSEVVVGGDGAPVRRRGPRRSGRRRENA